MQRGRDPVERAADEDEDLHGVATWEPRSTLDRVAVLIHRSIRPLVRVAIVLVALFMVAALFLGGLGQAVTDPTVRVLVVLSVVPALLLAGYVWYADVTTDEPLTVLTITFVLGVLLATFAALLNSAVQILLSDPETGQFYVPALEIVFFYLVVGPGEETVKLGAVGLYAYRDPRFDAVIDGAVYGAAAGLGFATIENALYITTQTGMGEGAPGLAAVTALRALAGPGHVIYSAIAGFYLGLAKFNPDHFGPLVVKGLLIAAFVHGTYNVTVGIVPLELARSVTGLGLGGAFIGYVLVFDGVIGYLLYRKIRGYRRAYRSVDPGNETQHRSDVTEFDGNP